MKVNDSYELTKRIINFHTVNSAVQLPPYLTVVAQTITNSGLISVTQPAVVSPVARVQLPR